MKVIPEEEVKRGAMLIDLLSEDALRGILRGIMQEAKEGYNCTPIKFMKALEDGRRYDEAIKINKEGKENGI